MPAVRAAGRRLRRIARRAAALTRPSRPPTPYEHWLEQRLRVRNRAADKTGDARFSILTTVFDTPTAFLAEAARSVFEQTLRPREWILLDNGSTRPDVVSLIDELAQNELVRPLRVGENVGIMNGMRRCLDEASGEYVVPLDSDDVLLPDALALLERAVADHSGPGFVYTDEDVLEDGRPRSPYLRPDWDPVLNLCTSYVFHLCAFRRDEALRLGVYTDDEARWCHDWDTVHRFDGDRASIVHVSEVAYHWRAHARSSTHRPAPESGSLASQRHVLERALALRARPELFDLELFPIDRGAPEWWIRRRREASPAIDVVTVEKEGGGVQGVADALAGDSDLTLVHREDVTPEGDEWLWEALALSELHPDAVLFSGRIVNRDRVVVAGGELLGFGGLVGTPDRGLLDHEPGYYALALKQRSVSACHPAFFLGRTDFLRTAIDALPEEATLGFLGAWLGAAALAAGRRVVFSPLIAALAPGVFTGEQAPGPGEATVFLERYGGLLPDRRSYSPHLAREHGAAYELADVAAGS
jgi:glycosyltransferase involved in cell wall biosynthesis